MKRNVDCFTRDLFPVLPALRSRSHATGRLWPVGAGGYSERCLPTNEEMRSTGTGNTTVELLSPATWVRVCR